ncbi:hypothetical protein FRB99_003230 [Tulasnella sp. 403]|nr:hypothetical protein FRB99_003230 [Tulasnella sp. 403]
MARDPQEDDELDWGDQDHFEDGPPGAGPGVDVDDGVDVVSLGGGEDDLEDYPRREDQTPPDPKTHSVQSSPQAKISSNSNKPSSTTSVPLSRSLSDTVRVLPPGLPQKPVTKEGAPTYVSPSDPSFMAASAMAGPPKAGNGLLPDWEPRTSRSGGDVYYYNVKTRESTWTKPVAPQVARTRLPPSPVASRRDRKRPPSPPSSTLPNPGNLPPRPQASYGSSHYRPARSPSPPYPARGRSRSRERNKDRGRPRPPEDDLKPMRMPYSPPPHKHEASPEPLPRRRASLSPPLRNSNGGRQRARSPLSPRGRGLPPRSRVPIDSRDSDLPPRASDMSYHANRPRSHSPPTKYVDARRPSRSLSRSPGRARDVRPRSPPPVNVVVPQKRRGDRGNSPRRDFDSTRPPKPLRRSEGDSLETKRRRTDFQPDSSYARRDRARGTERFDAPLSPHDQMDIDPPREVDEAPRRKRAPLPPQDQRFRDAVLAPPTRRSPPPSSSRPPVAPAQPSVPAGPRSTRDRPVDRPVLPQTSPAVAAAYGKRQHFSSNQPSHPPGPHKDANHPDFAGGSKLPPSGPAAVSRSGRFGPAPQGPSFSASEPDRDLPKGPRAMMSNEHAPATNAPLRRDRSPPSRRVETQHPRSYGPPVDDRREPRISQRDEIRHRDDALPDPDSFIEVEQIGPVHPSRLQGLTRMSPTEFVQTRSPTIPAKRSPSPDDRERGSRRNRAWAPSESSSRPMRRWGPPKGVMSDRPDEAEFSSKGAYTLNKSEALEEPEDQRFGRHPNSQYDVHRNQDDFDSARRPYRRTTTPEGDRYRRSRFSPSPPNGDFPYDDGGRVRRLPSRSRSPGPDLTYEIHHTRRDNVSESSFPTSRDTYTDRRGYAPVEDVRSFASVTDDRSSRYADSMQDGDGLPNRRRGRYDQPNGFPKSPIDRPRSVPRSPSLIEKTQDLALEAEAPRSSRRMSPPRKRLESPHPHHRSASPADRRRTPSPERSFQTVDGHQPSRDNVGNPQPSTAASVTNAHQPIPQASGLTPPRFDPDGSRNVGRADDSREPRNERRPSVRIVRRELSPIPSTTQNPRERRGGKGRDLPPRRIDQYTNGEVERPEHSSLPPPPATGTRSSLLQRISDVPPVDAPSSGDAPPLSLRDRVKPAEYDTTKSRKPEDEGDRRRKGRRRNRAGQGGR